MGVESKAATTLNATPVERNARKPVKLRGAAVREDGSSVDVVLLDLSYEGCGIETPLELEPGEPIKLSILCRPAIDAVVRWYEKGRAGLVFGAENPDEKVYLSRCSPRISLGAEVSLRRLGQSKYKLRVNDLSPEGCKVDLVERPRVGEHVLVKFAGLEALDAEVCWIDHFVAGLHFKNPIHASVFDLLLERLK
jgi:hypothetical protein